MRKKDYELIATVVRQFEPEMKEKLAWIFAGQFFAKGYKFDRQKFLTACGIEQQMTAYQKRVAKEHERANNSISW